MLQIEPEAARPWLARAIAAARASGQISQLSESLSVASTAEHMAGDGAAARRLLDEAESLAAGIDSYPAAIGLIQAQAIHAFFDRRPRHRQDGVVSRRAAEPGRR